ncbi:MAG TPA: DUF1990 domain-containing protein, partial [Terracidiphilus sp.]
MFRLTQPGAEWIASQVAAAIHLPPSCPSLLSLEHGFDGSRLPSGFAHDYSRSVIGQGEVVFGAARDAFRRWAQFDLGWVHVANPTAGIAVGQIVAIQAHTATLWSLNFSRVTETVDTPARFGFLYATTHRHIEEGQERFLIEYDSASGEVSYTLEAVSRPRHPAARL